jgi:4-hydroxy-tetrahydrodipicolinate synthase
LKLVKELEGSFAAMVTPFTEEGRVDCEGLERNIEFYLRNGIHGLVALGSTGEVISLTEEERLRIAELVVRKTAGRVPVCIGATAETTAHVIEYGRHALDIGADAVMVLPPYYMKPLQEEMICHFEEIAGAVDIPLMIYNNPGASGVDLALESVLKLADRENIRYIKESTGDIRRLRDITRLAGNKIITFCGCDDLALESFFVGARGWVSVVANFMPAEAAGLYEAARDGDYARARELYEQLLPFCTELETCGKLVQLAKYCLKRRGGCGGYSRKPRLPLDAQYRRKIDKMLEKAGLLA